MHRRPKPGETEKEILLRQREFLASRGPPAAQLARFRSSDGDGRSGSVDARDVVDLNAPERRAGPPRKRSKFKEEHSNQTDEEAAEALDTHDRHITRLLADVVKERDIANVNTQEPFGAQHGFPSVVAIGSKFQARRSKTEKSLFALHFEQHGGAEFGVPHSVLAPSAATSSGQTMPDDVMEDAEIGCHSMAGGQPIPGEDMAKIHEENLQQLAGMLPEEIASEQAKLEQTLGPDLVAFLRGRGRKKEAAQTILADQVMGGDSERHEAENGGQTVGKTDAHGGNAESYSEVPTEAKELQSLANKHTWLHMNRTELEKLEWMKDTTDGVVGDKDSTVRFGIDGSLIPRHSDLPVSLGLHHHGDDPQAAGYSLEELFTMVRSSVTQQRVLALQTIAKIVTKAWCGAFVDFVKGNLLQNLVDAGLPVLLRLSLDEPVESVSLATVQCLRSLLVESHVEDLMDVVACTWCGLFVPSLQVTMPTDDIGNDDAKRQTDSEVIQQDLIFGLLQMDLLPRLRYLLEVFHLPPPIVISVLEILTRIGRHSTEAACKIVDCSRLLDTVVSQFLPCSWRSSDVWPVKDVYGMPSAHAVKLICVLCAAGRNVAAKLMSQGSVVNALMRYSSQQPSQMDLPYSEALLLSMHSYRTLQSCITYGIASHCVSDFYPILMQRLLELNPMLSQLLPMPGSESRQVSASLVYLYCAVLGLVETCIHVGAVTPDQLQSQKNGTEEQLATPGISWHQVMCMLDPIKLAVRSLGQRLIHQEFEKLQDGTVLLLCGCLFNVLAAYYSHFACIALSVNVVDCLSELEDLVQTVLLPVIHGPLLTGSVKLMISTCMSSCTNPYWRLLSLVSVSTFPSLLASHVVPPAFQILEAQQWLGFHSFVAAVCRLSFHVVQVHRGCSLKVSQAICSVQSVIEYLELQLGSHPDALMLSDKRLMLHVRYFLVKLFLQARETNGDGSLSHLLSLYHSTALDLLAKLQSGDEYLVSNLVSDLIFRMEFFEIGDDIVSLATDLADLSVGSVQPMPPQPITMSRDRRLSEAKSLLTDSIENLPGIRQLFVASLVKSVSQRRIDQSRGLTCGCPFEVTSLILPPSHAVIMTVDWMFHPIVSVHNKATKGVGEDALSEEDVVAVCHNLRLLLLLERLRPESLRRVSVTTRFTRLLCVFLASNDLFLDDIIHVYMTALLRCYTRPAVIHQIDFNESIPGVLSFYDLYSAVLSQYAAVSYGDPLFGCFVLLPLQQRFSSRLRSAVWGEHASVLRSLAIPLSQIPVPLENFLSPHETDVELLNLYSTVLFTGGIRKQWSPLMYLVAVHHLNTFLFIRDIQNVDHHRALMNGLCLVQDEDVYQDLVLFAGVDVSLLVGFKLHDSIPDERAVRIRKFLSDKNNDQLTQIVQLRTPGF